VIVACGLWEVNGLKKEGGGSNRIPKTVNSSMVLGRKNEGRGHKKEEMNKRRWDTLVCGAGGGGFKKNVGGEIFGDIRKKGAPCLTGARLIGKKRGRPWRGGAGVGFDDKNFKAKGVHVEVETGEGVCGGWLVWEGWCWFLF